MESKLEYISKDPEEWIMELEILRRKIKKSRQEAGKEDLLLKSIMISPSK